MKIRALNGYLMTAVAAVGLQPVYAQVVSSVDGSRSILVSRFQSLIRQPGGIEKISDAIGDFSMDETPERWGEHNLRSLTQASSTIVIGVIQQAAGELTADGDSVQTAYTVQVKSSFKGQQATQLAFKSEGGEVKLSNGHTVTVHTPASANLKVGGRYVFFLERQGGTLMPIDGVEGLFLISQDGERVQLLDPDKSRTPELRYLDGARIETLEQEINNVKQ
jgi:hypothetical protein